MHILVIEDHPLIRLGIKMIISSIDPLYNISLATNFQQALEMLGGDTVDLVILDIDIPGGEHLKMIGRIRERQPQAPILVHTGFDETVYAIPYMKAGADGFLSKQASPKELELAIRTILDGKKYLSYEVQKIILSGMSESVSAMELNPISTLSKQEMIVMQYMIEGKWTKEIAASMNVKENTISTYKKRIYEKLNVSNPIELSKKVALLKQS